MLSQSKWLRAVSEHRERVTESQAEVNQSQDQDSSNPSSPGQKTFRHNKIMTTGKNNCIPYNMTLKFTNGHPSSISWLPKLIHNYTVFIKLLLLVMCTLYILYIVELSWRCNWEKQRDTCPRGVPWCLLSLVLLQIPVKTPKERAVIMPVIPLARGGEYVPDLFPV